MTPPFKVAASLAGYAHGFFGRDGGVSTGDYTSLNTGTGSNDSTELVAENLRRCCIALGGDNLYTGYQTHSAIARYIGAVPSNRLEGDAIITDRPGLCIGVLTADCVPVLFAEGELVGAAHAGWRGSLTGILEATIALMEAHGANPSKIKCAIGPALRSPLFEVGDDLVEKVIAIFPSAERFFTAVGPKHDYDHIGFARWRLEQSGVAPNNINDIGGNPLASPKAYFSYRASRAAGQADFGRNLSAITCPRP